MENGARDDFDTDENFNEYWNALRKAGPAEAEDLTYEKWKAKKLTRKVRSARELKKAAEKLVNVVSTSVIRFDHGEQADEFIKAYENLRAALEQK